MSIKHPTSKGQTYDQDAAVQRTFHFERNRSFLFFSTDGKDSMLALTSLYFAHSCTKPRHRLCPPEVHEATPPENNLYGTATLSFI